MREILFRGKTEQFGNWIEGSLIVGRDLESGQLEYLIAPLSAYYTEVKKVLPETTGQYTGLNDKNGKKIFEDDIVKCGDYVGVVSYSDTFAKFYVIYNETSGNWFDFEGENCDPIMVYCEVIGNIHNNPELFERSNNNAKEKE